MQRDFHFYTIYTLSRCAGFGPKEAEIVACASQFTDDATREEPFYFENGGFFRPIVTAHNYHRWLGGLKAITKEAGYQVWIPFHFMPGVEEPEEIKGRKEERFYWRLRVCPVRLGDDSPLDQALKRLLDLRLKPYSFHLLGIALHVLADTWSHQGFIGLTRPENEVEDLDPDGNGVSFWEHLKDKFVDLIPNTGHAEALTIPDEPFRCWSYTDFWGKRREFDNVERCLFAARACYEVLSEFGNKYLGKRKKRPFQEIEASLRKLFEKEGELENRCRWWQEAISGSEFFQRNSDESPEYLEGAWFRRAIEVRYDLEKKETVYRWRPNFNESDFRLFHAAAAFWRFVVLHEILPKVGVVCG